MVKKSAALLSLTAAVLLSGLNTYAGDFSSEYVQNYGFNGSSDFLLENISNEEMIYFVKNVLLKDSEDESEGESQSQSFDEK